MLEALTALFNDVVDLLVKDCLAKRKAGFVIGTGGNCFGLAHKYCPFHLEESMSFVAPVTLCGALSAFGRRFQVSSPIVRC
jgi:hypothetical protein